MVREGFLLTRLQVFTIIRPRVAFLKADSKMREIIRAVVIASLVFLMATDVKEILTELSNSATMKPFMEWINPHGGKPYRAKRRIHSVNPEAFEDTHNSSPYISDHFNTKEEDTKDLKEGNPLQDPALEAVRKKLQAAGFTSAATGQPANQLDFNDHEKEQIQALKTHITSVMQQWCLPKLVCELHASMSDRSTLTEAERSLLSLIRETSLGSMGEVVSRYHFAAHMGQLLSGVDGNGCHNLYPNCPLSGNKLYHSEKRVLFRTCPYNFLKLCLYSWS
ncbi:unnamed protein product [Allacma fusca]|uniref:Uncharacterized protein n=1 Tax=Allacma fusca TaxID=39272 RepID=A0A8J2Q2H5_9HEXA|nr:unnamed protein product [Allacma fusca]